MRNFKAELIKDVQLQRKLLAEHQKELKGLPPGSLSSYQAGKRTYRKYTIKKNGMRVQRNLSAEDETLEQQLCRKAFLKQQMRVMQSNLELQETLLQKYQPYNTRSILRNLKPLYASGVFLPMDDDFIREKQEKAFSQAIHPERLTQPTLAGFRVRSKSEALIVNMQTERRVRSVYEEPLVLEIPGRGTVTVHPDFTIYLDNGEIIIWEHLGMLSNDNYTEAQIRKLQNYHLAGYTLGKNLILTADNADGTLDVEVITRILDDISSRGGCY